MTRMKSIAVAVAALTMASLAMATTAPAPKSSKVVKSAKSTPKKAPVAAAAVAAVSLTPGQIDAAGRVFTGEASCEFGEKVHLTAVDGKPGHFKLAYKKASYSLVPEETTTGAVRLEDRQAGIVWLQIPAKSMLMNSRIGQRMADNCLHNEQRVAAAAPAAAAIGISTAVKP
jgi:hypothetical protein